MKIGILTYHYAYNYGAVLQAYALQQFFMSHNIDAVFVNYKNKTIENYYNYFKYPNIKINSLGKLYYFLRITLRCLLRIIRYNKFRDFMKNNLIISKNDSLEQFDLVIIGSDQVWNVNLTNGFDEYYWGDKCRNKCISYAASFNSDSITNNIKSILTEKLKNFKGVSVREESLKNELEAKCSIKVTMVLDPTLLVNPNIWHIFKSGKYNKKYVLVYTLRDEKLLMQNLKKIISDTNLDYYILRGDTVLNFDCHQKQFASPNEFCDLFANAEYVLTTSFHGTAFSIIYHKKFFTFKCTDGNNTRVESLLNSLGLSDRLISNYSQYDYKKEIDYSNVDKKLETHRIHSLNYIFNYLNTK